MGAFLVVFSLLLSLVSTAPTTRRNLNGRADSTTYDYVVVGCGASGLAVSMRLSSNPDVSVLCLEAGPFDDYEEEIQFPVYIGQQPFGFYDWGIYTVAQTQLDGLSREIPMGKGVGGGTLINGMVWSRGNQVDINAWEALGNPGWNWNNLLTYFKRSETFTPRTYPNAATQPVTYDSSVHGYDGPVQVSYAEYYWSQTDNWFQALNDLNIPTVFDPNEGQFAGAFFLPSDIHPTNQTRTDARRSYYDPYAGRSNFNVLALSQVTSITFDTSGSSLVATGVTYSSDSGATTQSVTASQEVIIAAGAVHSPQILQLSGIGPSSLLEGLGISVLQDLPGVGNNLQDHPMIHLNYSYTNPNIVTPYSFESDPAFNAASEQEYLTSKTGPWTARESSGVAFPSLEQITQDTQGLLDSAGQGNLPSTYESTLQSGYSQQFNTIMTNLALSTTPAYEILNNNAGGLDACLMHPLSRGTVEITSADPFTTPSVDPRWLVNPFDFDVMVAALQFNQQILNTKPIQALDPSYDIIPENASVDQLSALLRSGIGTEYHYSGTCAMMPLDMGGVVDSNLLVYGTSNLRVIDTSIFPLIPAAHLQAVAYAVAEKAADIISGAI